jgi:hypothetical protein
LNSTEQKTNAPSVAVVAAQNVIHVGEECDRLADGKCAPKLVIIGAMKCGTNGLYRLITLHPHARFPLIGTL